MAVSLTDLFKNVTQWVYVRRALENAPPASPVAPASGDRYVVGTSGSGAWSGQNEDIARYDGSAYAFQDAARNMRVYNRHDRSVYGYDGADWQRLLVLGPEPYEALTVASHAASYDASTSVNKTCAHPAAALAIDWIVETLWSGAHGTLLITNHASDVSDLPTFTVDEGTSNVVLIGEAAFTADFDTSAGARSWWEWTYDGSKLWIRYEGGQD